MDKEEEFKKIQERVERLKRLRSGEEVPCPKCDGIIKPIGDYRFTNSFHCTKCNYQIILN